MARIPGFRWRIVPAFLLGVFGVACVFGGLARIGMMSFAYHQYGHFHASPDTPTLNQVAISPRNVAAVIASISGGTVLFLSGVRLWPRWHRREITQ